MGASPQTRNTSAFAPGRINLIGEHTDYNQGFVLPAAISQKITFNAIPNGHKTECRITATDLGETISFDLGRPAPIPGSWSNYVVGLCDEILKSGGNISGFDASFGGDIPIGAGLSSSAALLCSAAIALDTCFNLKKSRAEWMYITQKAEHHFVGTNCGLMDMFASLHGKKHHLMLFDCRQITFEYVPFHLKNYELILLNTGVSHQLATSEYNTRRKECEEVIRVIRESQQDISSLRDVSIDLLREYKDQLSGKMYRRAHYVIEENARVLKAVSCLENGDIGALGALLYASHSGLKNEYEVSCQELDFLVSFTEERPEVAGARMMGGGFGGCTLNLVERDASHSFLHQVKAAYQNEFGAELPHYAVEPSEGASLIA
jgi:galactokinase